LHILLVCQQLGSVGVLISVALLSCTEALQMMRITEALQMMLITGDGLQQCSAAASWRVHRQAGSA
jgi:hypothetical protein